MKRTSPVCLLTFATCIIASQVLAQSVSVITLTLRAANYEDAPVQLLGLKHADESGSEPYVHFRNVSSVKTSRIWVEAVVNASDEGGRILSRTNSNIPNLRWQLSE
jgi:hypothetical protein